MEKQWQCCLLFLWPVMKFAYVVDVLYSLVITFHFILTDGSFLKEFTTLKSYYFTLRKEERFI